MIPLESNTHRFTPAIRRVVESATTRARDRGATALLVIGSHARGSASPLSDLDLLCLGDGPDYELEVIAETLVSWSWRSPANQRERLLDPAHAALEVPAWRESLIIFDDLGEATELQVFANNWGWELLGASVDNWLATEFAGLAEEVLKIIAACQGGDGLLAVVQTRFLATRLLSLGPVVQRRLLASENDIWTLEIATPKIGEDLQHALANEINGFSPGEISLAVAAVLRAYLAMATDHAPKSPEREASVMRFTASRILATLGASTMTREGQAPG